MQLGTGGVVIPLLAVGPGQSHAGEPRKFIFTAQKVIDWLIIYSFFHVKFTAV